MGTISDGKLDFVFGDPKNWPALRVSQANQLNLENADFNLEKNRSIIFAGNAKTSALGDMSFLTGDTSPTERMKIFANGNIGIGTGATEPTSKLEVDGKIKATDLEVSGTVTAKNFIGEIAGLNDKVSKAGDTITGALTVQNALTVNGNLGIGKPAAKEKLEVDGKIKATDLEVSGTVTAKNFIGEIAGLNDKVSKAGDTITGALTVENALTVNGNLGIGKAAEKEKLEVDGKIKATDLEVSGTVTAKNFIGEIAGLNDKVSKAGDTITGALTVENALTVNGKIKATDLEVSGTVTAKNFVGQISGLNDKVSKAGDTITGPLTIQNALTVSGNVSIGTTRNPAILTVNEIQVRSLKILGLAGQILTIFHDTVNWNFQTEPNLSGKTMVLHGGDADKNTPPVWFTYPD